MSNADRLQLYLDAEAKILAGQVVEFEGRKLQLPDLAEVRAEIRRLQAAVAVEQRVANGGGTFRLATFPGEGGR